MNYSMSEKIVIYNNGLFYKEHKEYKPIEFSLLGFINANSLAENITSIITALPTSKLKTKDYSYGM